MAWGSALRGAKGGSLGRHGRRRRVFVLALNLALGRPAEQAPLTEVFVPRSSVAFHEAPMETVASRVAHPSTQQLASTDEGDGIASARPYPVAAARHITTQAGRPSECLPWKTGRLASMVPRRLLAQPSHVISCDGHVFVWLDIRPSMLSHTRTYTWGTRWH